MAAIYTLTNTTITPFVFQDTSSVTNTLAPGTSGDYTLSDSVYDAAVLALGTANVVTVLDVGYSPEEEPDPTDTTDLG